MEKKIYILNFGRELSPEVINDIKNQYHVETEEIFMPVNINLHKSSGMYIQCVDIINRIPKDILNGCNKIVINPPGLPNAACCLITEIHARIGYFPILLEMYRDRSESPIFNDFRLRRLIDLERERQVSRSKKFES